MISSAVVSLTNCTSSGIVSSREYDALGRVVASTDGRGNTTTLSYDAQGRVSWTESPLSLGEGQGEGASVARTTYGYDALGRQVAITNALGQATYTAYDAEDRVLATWGATYPVAYAYDAFGRMTAMNTFRDEAMENGDTTTWLYDEPTGLLTNKVYADGKGPSYTYTSDGKLATRTWARGITTTYAYDAAGQLTGVDYSDNTPDIAYTYDRLGRQLSAVSSVSTNLFEYDGLDLVSETQNGVVITRATDALGRSTGFSVAGVGDPGSPYAVTYGYDAYGRFLSVSSSVFSVSSVVNYSYLPGSDLVSGMTASTGHAWTRSYEPQRNLISAVENTYGSTVISRFDYVNDAIGRRTSRVDSGQAFQSPAFDVYSYNTRSEVIGAQRYHGTDVSDTSRVYGGREFGYNYDLIGNRTTASETIGGETLVKTYAANELNQYTAIANPDAVGLRGSATNTATVTVNGEAALSDSIASTTRPWHFALPADNANGGAYTFASIMAVVNPPGTNEADLVSTASGSVYVPPQNETLVYDDDGNLLSDGRWHYTWNGENRLVCAEEQVCPTNRTLRKVEYAYDHQGRMVGKVVSRRGAEAQSWEAEKSIAYLWDNFNIIAESIHHSSFSNHNFYIWGLDLDGTLQGAGGVGGLLAVVKGSSTYVPTYDGNGNVMEYVSSDGTIAAHREYDPFGGTVVATGDTVAFAHWFSTKPWCDVVGLSEYQYRKYSPVMGRWMNRDPIWEEGGVNLHVFVWNSSIVYLDVLGLATSPLKTPAEENCMACCRVYIALTYKPDLSTTDRRLASNGDIVLESLRGWDRDATPDSRRFWVSIKNVGKGGEILQAELQKIASKPQCTQGLSVIIHGHGSEKVGLLYPIQAYDDFTPQQSTTYPGDGSLYMPSPSRPAPPGFGGATWSDIWPNLKTMHVRACFSSLDRGEFSGQFFTGYSGTYHTGGVDSNPVTSAPIPPSPKPPR